MQLPQGSLQYSHSASTRLAETLSNVADPLDSVPVPTPNDTPAEAGETALNADLPIAELSTIVAVNVPKLLMHTVIKYDDPFVSDTPVFFPGEVVSPLTAMDELAPLNVTSP